MSGIADLTYISLFAGIEGFGFADCGMKPSAFVEIDVNARSILSLHYPDVLQVEDVKNAGKHNLPAADVVCGGFPCTDVSVAGRRAGLAGEQSGLWFEFHRILIELKPAWVVIENVPGLLSSNEGKDFAVVLGGLTGSIPAVPQSGWRNAGVIRGNPQLYNVAWRVLDAQYFGVAQRRRRVFIVANLAAVGGGCAQVLFERESGARHLGKSRKAREGIASTVKASAPSRRNGGSSPTAGDFVVNSVKRRGEYGYTVNEEVTGTLEAANVTGVDAIPLVFDTTQITSPENASNPQPGDPCHTLSAHQHVPLVTGTLSAAGGRNRNLGQENEVDMLVVETPAAAFRRSEFGDYEHDDNAGTLVREEAKNNSTLVAFNWQNSPSRSMTPDAIVPTLETDKVPAVWQYSIRRLTPIECERLQVFPDNYTQFGINRKRMSDTVRYQKCGNAVCRTVGMWIGRRIVAVHRGEMVS